MNPNAISDNTFMLYTSSIFVNPIPSIPNLPKQYGPIKIPPTKYPVTAGRFNLFTIQDIISPTANAIPILNNIFSIFFPLFIHINILLFLLK